MPFLFTSSVMIKSFFLENRDSKVELLNWGATIKSWLVQDGQGNKIDIVLGFNENQRYQEKHPSFGCIVGRYANRIAKGTFTLNGVQYHLDINNGPNHLHGGIERFGNKIWNVVKQEPHSITFSYESPAGESNYPGKMLVLVSYFLSNDNELIIEYQAESDEDTICNLTNHCYFNLNGESNGTVLDHSFQIHAQHFLPTDDESIPTGVIQAVDDTVMDFRKSRRIDSDHFNTPLLDKTNGYDHNYVLGRTTSERLAATVTSERSRLRLECYTDQPGVQFFTANGLSDLANKNGGEYIPYSGFCLEAQHFPDSPNHAHFPSPILRKGESYTQKTTYKVQSF